MWGAGSYAASPTDPSVQADRDTHLRILQALQDFNSNRGREWSATRVAKGAAKSKDSQILKHSSSTRDIFTIRFEINTYNRKSELESTISSQVLLSQVSVPGSFIESRKLVECSPHPCHFGTSAPESAPAIGHRQYRQSHVSTALILAVA